MASMKYPQTEICDKDAVSKQSGNPEPNVAHVSFENITHASQYLDDSSASHTKNGGNPTVERDTQPLNATVTPNKSHIPTKLIELGHDSPRQRNLKKLSYHEKSFEYGFDSYGGRGPFMETVDEEGEQDFEE